MTEPVVTAVDVDAAPTKVWEAITSPAMLAQWWWPQWPDTHYEVSPGRFGGYYRFESHEGGLGVHGEFIVREAPSHLELSWVWEEAACNGTTDHVLVVIDPCPKGSTVTVTHTVTDPSDDKPVEYIAGWSDVLNRLRRVLSRGRRTRLPAMSQLAAVMGRGVVPADTPLVTADDLGLTRGDGVFDATRVVTSDDGTSRIDHLDRHLARFARSIAAMDGPVPDADAWRALLTDLAGEWTEPGEAVLKFMWTRGAETTPGASTEVATITTLGASTVRARTEGLRVATLTRGWPSDLFGDVPWLLGGVKSLSYGVNVAAKREADRRGVDEALFVTSDGFCLEGPTSALIVAVSATTGGSGLLTTPVHGTGILPSITQQVLFEAAAQHGVDCRTRLLTPDDVVASDGAWLVSSVRGVAPITTLDDRAVPQDPEVTARLNQWAGFAES